jgi:succinate-semialdehyde dehydrogenase/glutarate-semialdehyde dehydrogenase
MIDYFNECGICWHVAGAPAATTPAQGSALAQANLEGAVMTMQSINPADGEVVGSYAEITPAAAASAVGAAHAAFPAWRRTSFAARAALMRKAAGVLRARSDEFARLMALEMGKPVTAGAAEVAKCAVGCEYYAEHAERFLAPEAAPTESRKSFVAYNPVGVVLAVMPWNFPFWQVLRFAAPTLMAGNTAVLKHASNVQGCALAIESVFHDAGFPRDVFRTLVIGSGQVDALVENRHVRAITLTGSGPAGRKVAAKAGAMLKKTVLELGGSDAYLVLEDADLDLAAAACAKGRLVNSGQSCIAAKRFVVVERVRAPFEERFVAEMAKARFGDPLDAATVYGPLARQDLRDELHRQVEASVAGGARKLLGGEVPAGRGAFYPATVLTDVRAGTPAHDDELFGPVASIISARDEADAIRIANASAFGLGGGVFTRDLARGERIATESLEAGSAFVNQTVVSDPRLPFGGVKESGYGRELASFGIREFVDVKAVSVA